VPSCRLEFKGRAHAQLSGGIGRDHIRMQVQAITLSICCQPSLSNAPIASSRLPVTARTFLSPESEPPELGIFFFTKLIE